jgi:hypothetical protein
MSRMAARQAHGTAAEGEGPPLMAAARHLNTPFPTPQGDSP